MFLFQSNINEEILEDKVYPPKKKSIEEKGTKPEHKKRKCTQKNFSNQKFYFYVHVGIDTRWFMLTFQSFITEHKEYLFAPCKFSSKRSPRTKNE